MCAPEPVGWGSVVESLHERCSSEFCASPEWRTMVEEQVLPDALQGVDLGSEVIEIGLGPG